METRKRAGEVHFLDKDELLRIVTELDRRMDEVHDPTATAERAREMQRESGIRAEDNTATRELYRMRYGGNWEDDWPKEQVGQSFLPAQG